MAKNSGFIDYTTEAAYELLKKGNDEVLRGIGLIDEFNKKASSAKTPSGNDSAIKALNEQIKAQDAQIKKLQESYLKLSETKKRNAQQTAQESVNQGILNRQARQAAIINSTLASEYAKLSAREAEAARRVQDLIALNGKGFDSQTKYNSVLRTAQREFDELRSKVLQADKAVGRWQRTGERTFQFGKDLIGAFGVVTGVALFASIARDIFNTTRELQSLNLALKQVIGSEEEAAKTQIFLSNIAEDYGVNINVLTKSYTGFFAASKNAINSGKISAQQIRDIFQSVSKAAGAMGLSVDQQQGAFLALSQMISKGNVQAEELRGQLSERLPGAFGILAKSMGVTEEELNKLLKDGKVLAAEVLPAFARELEKAYGVENLERVETLNAATTRLQNTWISFVRTLNEADGVFSKTLVTLIEGLENVLKGYDYLFSTSTNKRKKENQRFYEDSYEEASRYYRFLQEESGKSAKEAEREIRNNSAYAAEKAKANYEEVKSLQARNAELRKNTRKTPFGTIIDAKSLAEIRKNNDAIFELNKSTSRYNGQVAAANDLLNKNTQATSLNTEAKKENRKYDPEGAVLAARIRYLKSLSEANDEQYEAEKKRTEREIADLDKLAKNEQRSFQDRITSYGEMLQKKQDLMSGDFARTLLKINEQEKIELAENDKAYRAELKRAGKNAEAIEKITGYYSGTETEILRKAQEKRNSERTRYDRDYLNIVEETSAAELEIVKKQREIIEKTDKNYRDSQIRMFNEVSNNSRLSLEVRQAAFNASIALQRKELDLMKIRDLSEAGDNDAKIAEIKSRYQELNNILNQTSQKSSPFANAVKNANDELINLRNTLSSDVFQGAGFSSLTKFFDFDESGKSSFTKLIEGLELIEDKTESSQKKFAAYFNAVTEIFQEAVNAISQLNQAAYEAQLSRLEKQKEIAIRFAGESTTAREEIEEQYEARRRQLANEQAKQQKELAIFNAIINVAQGITAALGTGPGGIALAAIIGALGAVQIALIASQPLPEYWKGRDGGPAEWAWTQERGAEMITDKDGKIKTTGTGSGRKKTWLEKGDKVWTAGQTRSILDEAMAFNQDLNRLMFNNSISMPAFNNSNVAIDYGRFGSEMERVMNKRPTVKLEFNENGFRKSLTKGHSKINYLNNRVSGKGDTV